MIFEDYEILILVFVVVKSLILLGLFIALLIAVIRWINRH